MKPATPSHRSANGAALYQPGATPQEHRFAGPRGLKARFIRWGRGPGFQPSECLATDTQGVALGWNRTGALPLARDAASDALSLSKGAEVLENIKRSLSLAERALL